MGVKTPVLTEESSLTEASARRSPHNLALITVKTGVLTSMRFAFTPLFKFLI